MRFPPKKFLWLTGGALAAGLVALWLARAPLLDWALRRGLAAAGATEVSFDVTQVSLSRIAIAGLALRYWDQPLRAGEVTLTREHPLSASPGRLQVSGLVAEVSAADLPKLEARAKAAAAPAASAAKAKSAAPPRPPLDAVSVDGTLKIITGPGDQAVKIDFAATTLPDGGADVLSHWSGRASLTAPGLAANLTGDYDLGQKRGAFQLVSMRVDLAEFRAFAATIQPLPMADWDAAGTVTADGAGTWRDGKPSIRLNAHLRDGHLAHAAHKVSLDGVAADLEFPDLPRIATAPGQSLRAAEIRLGAAGLEQVSARLQLTNLHGLSIESAAATAFGGRLVISPFKCDPARAEYAFTADCAGLQLDQLQPLLPPKVKEARGRIDGHVSIRYDSAGGHLGPGWVRLQPETPATLLYQYPDGMLTRNLGLNPQFAAYPDLKAVEGARLPLRVKALSIRFHPTDGPPDRYASIHLEAEPDDPKHPVPLQLDINLNGPVEELLDWGLKTHLNVSSGARDKH